MKKIFIFDNGFYFCEDGRQNNSFFFSADVYLSAFIIGTRILSIHTDKGWYEINLEKENFTVFNHVNHWWITGTPNKKLEKGDLTA